MWIGRGLNIRHMKFRLPYKGTQEKPEVEILLDGYRNYKRPKRSGLVTSRLIKPHPV